MPKFLCVRTCWDDCEAKGNHRIYDEGKVYTLAKGIIPPRHLVQIKGDEDGDIEIVGEIMPKKGATPKQVAQDTINVKEIVKKITKKDLPDEAFKKVGAK